MSAREEEIKLAELLEALRAMTVSMKEIVDDPTVLDEMSGVEIAWLQEHIEHMIEESNTLKVNIEKLLEAS